MEMMRETEMLTVEDVARTLGVSRTTVYTYKQLYALPITDGRIPRALFDAWRATFTPAPLYAKRRRQVDMNRPVVIDARIEADRSRPTNRTRKLSVAQRKEAAARYWSGRGWTLQDLAEHYGVSVGRMSVITRTYMSEEQAQ